MNYNLQRLRAAAAIAVLLFHSVPIYERVGGSLGFFRPVLAAGYAGVDLFFVLSGFIIARVVSDERYDAVAVFRFLEKRAYRIFLGYWPILGVSVLFYQETMPERAGGLSVATNLFLLSNQATELVIGQAWSLSYELFFYLSFGLLAFFHSRVRTTLLVGYSAVVLLLNLANPGLAKCLIVNPYVIELFAGALLGSATTIRWEKLRVGVLALIASFLFGVWIGFEMRAPLARALILGGAGMALIALAEVLRRRGVNRVSFMSRLGDSSFSLYLVHYVMLEGFSVFLLPVAPLEPYLRFVLGIWLGGIVCVSHVFYLWIERPLYDYVCAVRGLRANHP